MVGRHEEIAYLQSDVYRVYYHKILRWLMVSIVIMSALILAILYLVFTQPVQRYYANTTEGVILDMPR